MIRTYLSCFSMSKIDVRASAWLENSNLGKIGKT
jgi:hypothetical protein